MRTATKAVATWLGIAAGIAGMEHGYFEFLQGSTKPAGTIFPSMGPPCDPLVSWNACEPAISFISNYLATGILAFCLGLLILVWSAAFIKRKNGGAILIGLCVALLLVGGGIFPPVIGIVGGIAGLQIEKPINRPSSSGLLRSAAKLWPWTLIAFMVWVLGQFPFGYFFNDFLKSIMVFGMVFILAMLPISLYAAYAYDVQAALKAMKR